MKSASSLGLKANATKHSIFRAVRKMRMALEPFVETDRTADPRDSELATSESTT